MELPLFDQVDDLIHALAPDELGDIRSRAHRRGVKVWFGPAKPPQEHFEAQLLGRHHVDGVAGMALEIGFHCEHRDVATNAATLDLLMGHERTWRKSLGTEAEPAVFFGADNWRRLSEAWVEPELEDPDLAFEVASRLVDYLAALQPLLRAHRAP